jgi:hypothetical protein
MVAGALASRRLRPGCNAWTVRSTETATNTAKRESMKWMMLGRKPRPGHRPGVLSNSAVRLACLVLTLILPGTCLMAQVLRITNAVLLSWPEPTQEQIVVGSDSSTGPVWTPWPEPIFKRHGEICMSVPTTASQQFFKLVRGNQFLDDYSDVLLPYTNRVPYSNWVSAASGFNYQITNGTYRIARQGPWPSGTDSGALTIPMPYVLVRDFSTSVDILGWTNNTTNWNVVYLMARSRWVSGGGIADSGALDLNPSDGPPGSFRLLLSANGTEARGPLFDGQQNPPPYRLQFSGLGTHLSLRVVSLTTGQILKEMSRNDSVLTEGFVGIWVANAALRASESYTITLDNLFISGTRL